MHFLELDIPAYLSCTYYSITTLHSPAPISGFILRNSKNTHQRGHNRIIQYLMEQSKGWAFKSWNNKHEIGCTKRQQKEKTNFVSYLQHMTVCQS